MEIWQATILGIFQGLTEFLPVSSSAHLVFLHGIFGQKNNNLLFDVILHIGTLTATLIFFREKIIDLIINFKENLKTIFYIILAIIPTGIIGLLAKDKIEELFSKPFTAAIFLLITAIFLFLTRFSKDKDLSMKNMGIWIALFLGLVQGFAIIPGISRSGSTISAALFLGIIRKDAGEFSFLISIPAVAGAVLLEGLDLSGKNLEGFNWSAGLIGLLVSFVIGFFALKLLISFVKKGKIWVFSFYCATIAIIALAYFN